MLATISRQLPPQTLTTSLSCAPACIGAKDRANAPIAKKNRFMVSRLRFARHRVDARQADVRLAIVRPDRWLVQPLRRAAGEQGGTCGSRVHAAGNLNEKCIANERCLHGERAAPGLVDARQEGTVEAITGRQSHGPAARARQSNTTARGRQ